MIRSRASIRCGVLRRWVPTCTTRLCLRAAASIAWPSTTSTLIGFCTVDVGPGLDGGDHRQGVPVVGRGDQDDVEVLLLEHLAVVAEGPRLLLRGLARGDDLGGLGQHLLVDVAERDDLDRRHLDQAQQVALAVPAGADQADALGLLSLECPGMVSERRPGKTGRAGLKKRTTIHGTSPLPEAKLTATQPIHFSGARACMARGQSHDVAGRSVGFDLRRACNPPEVKTARTFVLAVGELPGTVDQRWASAAAAPPHAWRRS